MGLSSATPDCACRMDYLDFFTFYNSVKLSLRLHRSQVLTLPSRPPFYLATCARYGNAIGDDGAIALAELFRDNNKQGIPLETLGLGVNNIGAAGAAALAQTLSDCRACPLKTLGLYRNLVGDDGAVALSSMVANNHVALSALFLGGNGVGNRGAEALAGALATNTQLKVLSLEGGTVGNGGAVALGKALSSSRSLTTLDIRSCLPTHRNCITGQLNPDDAKDDAGDPSSMSYRGFMALKEAVKLRGSGDGPALKVIGDIDFGIS